jgi:hypothetical protein
VHANELLKRIVNRIVHHTESERDLLLAAVDIAFPLDEPKPELPGGGGDQAVDEGQAHEPDTGTPGVTASPLFSDTNRHIEPGAAGA